MKRWLLLCVLTALLLSTSCSGRNIHEHEYGNWEIKTQPTCTVSGMLVRRCSCGSEEEHVVEPLTHSYDDGKIIDSPTCVKRGLKHYTCKLCGELLQKIMDTTPHTVNEKYDIITEDSHVKKCTVCAEVAIEEEHYFYDGICLLCGLEADIEK